MTGLDFSIKPQDMAGMAESSVTDGMTMELGIQMQALLKSVVKTARVKNQQTAILHGKSKE